MSRDPRVDPRPGDVLRMRFRDQPTWTRTVIERDGERVKYRSSGNGLELDEDMDHWLMIRYLGAEVLHVAD